MGNVLTTVCLSRAFERVARTIWSEEEVLDLCSYLAENPEAGVLIEGGGGLRKYRHGTHGRGKRGGARVIYYYHDGRMPIALLAVYPKNTKSDLTKKELAAAVSLIEEAKKIYGVR